MSAILVTGYTATELGIFKDSDERINIIKKVIKKDLISFIEEGITWFIFTGKLGFEYWVLEIAKKLQSEYDIKLATLFLFENHGQNWNDENQKKLELFKTVDFFKYIFPFYEHYKQLISYNHYLINHTSGSYLFYDEEKKTTLDYLFQLMKEDQKYDITQLTFERLNDILEDLE